MVENHCPKSWWERWCVMWVGLPIWALEHPPPFGRYLPIITVRPHPPTMIADDYQPVGPSSAGWNGWIVRVEKHTKISVQEWGRLLLFCLLYNYPSGCKQAGSPVIMVGRERAITSSSTSSAAGVPALRCWKVTVFHFCEVHQCSDDKLVGPVRRRLARKFARVCRSRLNGYLTFPFLPPVVKFFWLFELRIVGKESQRSFNHDEDNPIASKIMMDWQFWILNVQRNFSLYTWLRKVSRNEIAV